MSHPGPGGLYGQQPWQQQGPGQPQQPYGYPGAPDPSQYPQPGPQGAPQGYPPPAGYPAAPPPGYQGGPPPGYPPGQFGYAQPMPDGSPGKGKRGLIIGLVVVLLAVIGGGVTWLTVWRNSGPSGAASPNEAALALMDSVNSGDVIGLLDMLAPAEADVLTASLADSVEEYKRLRILDDSADLRKLSGIEFKAENLTFDENPERINDHLAITKLTGGVITFSADPGKLPIAQEFKDAVMPPDVQGKSETTSIDIAKDVVGKGEDPIAIATVNIDGEWYPSLFYTIAHYGLKDSDKTWPDSAIPANGAASPNEAVTEVVNAIQRADVNRVIELLPPDEMAVLHDLGPALVEMIGQNEPLGFELGKLETEEREVEGGTRLTLTALEVREPGGPGVVSIKKDGECYEVAAASDTQRFCANDIGQLAQNEGGVPPEAVQPVVEIVQALFNEGVGVVTTEVDGKHYLSPMRTYNDLGMTVLRAIKPEHVTTLIELGSG